MDPTQTPLIIVLAVLLVCSALASASETALFGISHGQRAMIRRTNPRLSRVIESLLSRPRELLMQVLLLNMTVNVAYFIVTSILTINAESAIAQVVISIGSLATIILVGEVFAKLFASSKTVFFLRFAAPMHLVLRRALVPLLRFLDSWIIAPFARLLSPQHGAHKSHHVSPEQLGTLIELSANAGVIDPGEQEILTSIVTMSQIRVEQVMTPRVDMSWIGFDATRDEIIERCRETSHTRLLICEDGIDSGVEGIINARRVLEGRTIQEDLSPVLYVPEQSKLDMLIEQFRRTAQSIAVCVDEHGGVSGVVTIADVTKELIEGVVDPTQDIAKDVELIGNGKWLVPGRISIRDWMEMFSDKDVLEHAKRVNTLGGLVMVMLDRVPELGDEVIVGDLKLSVAQMEDRSIQRVVVEILDQDSAPTTNGQPPKQSGGLQ